MSSGRQLLISLADKIYEEDNEVYSSTQHNEDQSCKEAQEPSQDDLQFIGMPAEPMGPLGKKKGLTFLETLYNHKTNLDNERVTVARKRLEEKYSGATWKLKNDTLNSSLKKKTSIGSNLPPQSNQSKVSGKNENASQLGSSTSISAITQSPSFKPGNLDFSYFRRIILQDEHCVASRDVGYDYDENRQQHGEKCS